MRTVDPQSNVDLIEHALSTDPVQHVWEMDQEWWNGELGERPATHVAIGEADRVSWLLMVGWPYRERVKVAS